MTTSKKTLSRRQMLTTAGLTVGGGLLAIHGTQSQAENSQPSTTTSTTIQTNAFLENDSPTVPYTPISSKEAAALAYQSYSEGLCMYSTFKGIVSLVAKKQQLPIPTAFYNLFKYGYGGCAGWGSLCGVCNGAAAAMGLFCEDKKIRDQMITELFRWYESADLPTYVPAGSSDKDFPRSVAGSILCHPSTNQWSRAAKVSVFSPERKERCGRLAADVAKKAVEILNAQYAADKDSLTSKQTDQAPAQPLEKLDPPDSCIACHSTPGGQPGSFVAEAPKTTTKMDCSKCHYMPPGHPESMGTQMPIFK